MEIPGGLSILTVPGLYGSGPEHWQAYWEKAYPQITRVEQKSWDGDNREQWIETLQQAIHTATNPIILVAHSLGCILTAHWVSRFGNGGKVRAALLVAPCDVESKQFPAIPRSQFAPIPQVRFPFRTIVAASTNDEYATIDRSERFAAMWGAEFVNLGERGHINADSRLMNWPEGQRLLRKLY